MTAATDADEPLGGALLQGRPLAHQWRGKQLDHGLLEVEVIVSESIDQLSETGLRLITTSRVGVVAEFLDPGLWKVGMLSDETPEAT